MKKKHTIITLILFLFQSFYSFSQNYSNEKDYYYWFDSIIGIDNTSLFNGPQYKEKYRTLKGNHKFYQSSQYFIGNIVYDQQPYFNIEMKYDIFEDEIIIKSPYHITYFIIKLIKEKVDSFSINNHHFIKVLINKKDKSKSTPIFYEVIFKNEYLTLFKKHKKNINNRIENNFAYSEFKENYKFKIFLHDNNYYDVKSKKDFIKLFPNQKKEIKKFYNTNKRLRKSNFDLFIKLLVKQLKPINH